MQLSPDDKMKKLELYFASSSDEESDEDSLFDNDSDSDQEEDDESSPVGNIQTETANLIDIDLVNLLKYCK